LICSRKPVRSAACILLYRYMVPLLMASSIREMCGGSNDLLISVEYLSKRVMGRENKKQERTEHLMYVAGYVHQGWESSRSATKDQSRTCCSLIFRTSCIGGVQHLTTAEKLGNSYLLMFFSRSPRLTVYRQMLIIYTNAMLKCNYPQSPRLAIVPQTSDHLFQ